jgi:glycosyltransferase involved in cell wall biosynthesis
MKTNKGNRLMFYSSVTTKSLFQTQKFYYIDIHILQSLGYEVTLSNNILDAFKFWKYDIVFGYFFRYSSLFALISKCFGKRVYLTGGIDALDKSYAGEKAYKIQKALFKLCYFLADRCIIVSKSDLAHVNEIIGGGANRLAYSEHSIDTSAFSDAILTNKNLDFCTIAWMGDNANVYRKGVDKSIYLFSLLKEKPEFANSKLYIIGKKGIGTRLLESQIRELGLKDNVIITGEVPECKKIGILKRCKYYFQLSQYEGFGIAALEALIAGNVIIHSGNGGLANPIYKDHILVDIHSDMNEQFEKVYKRIRLLDLDIIQKNARECLAFYDNARRTKDFECIIGKCD